ncbi:MAG TPA: hypothetical protein DCL41_09790 [Bdellovibrionales bacterium]|nr:hypothetical protein [Bdellovibrionales bacterium]
MVAELRIREILESPSSISDKIYVLVEEAKSKGNQFAEVLPYLKFLYNSGHHQELASLIAGLIENKNQISWSLLLSILSRSQMNLPTNLISSIEKGIKRQNADGEIWSVESLDFHFQNFPEIRRSFVENEKNAFHGRREELIEKFEFLKNQRLDLEARQVLRGLIESFPDDPTIKDLESNFLELQAREMLSNVDLSHEETKTYIPRFSEEEKKFLHQLRDHALNDQASSPKNLVEVAYFLMFIEDFESALKLINFKSELSFNEYWLKAELLKLGRRFVEALEWADEILKLFSGEPETLVACLYFKAEVFSEMKQNSKALEILESISKVRPGYRSSSHMIQRLRNKGSFE